MPGIVHTKRGGQVYPPDWSQIGYDDTPISTMNGFNYAKDIQDNWDTSVHTYTEKYRDDYHLMYFPKMDDAITVSMERCARMFQGSNLEYFDSSMPFVQEFSSMFASCKNLRYCRITGLDTPGVGLTNANGLFTDCYEIREVDIDFSDLPSGCTQAKNLFSGCWKLEKAYLENDYIELADTAFQNTYKMQECYVKLPKCRECSFYAMGSQTDDGTKVYVWIGSTSTYTNTHVSFEKAKINGAPVASKSSEPSGEICLYNVDSAQSIFRDAIFTPYENHGVNAAITLEPSTGHTMNCSYMFQRATVKSSGFSSLTIGKFSNGNYMFDHFVIEESYKHLVLSMVDFSAATSLNYCFANMDVKKITGLDNTNLGSCTSMTDMFSGSNTLDNDTVNDILQLLTTATAYTGTKTLAALGFTSTYYPAATIQSLSNYSAFTAAGWSIGY